MKDIKCPSCGKTFKIDRSNFDQLLSQIKNDEFNKQINERLTLAKKEKDKEIELIKTELKLERIKAKKLDITNFENTLNQFKYAVGNNVRLASDRFKDAISGIDKTIRNLEKTKEALLLSEQHLQRANIKSQDLTIKKLTYNNPTMKKEFNKQNSND